MPCYHNGMVSADREQSPPEPRPGAPCRVAVLLLAAAFLMASCDPFVARVKGGNKSRPDWEIGVKF